MPKLNTALLPEARWSLTNLLGLTAEEADIIATCRVRQRERADAATAKPGRIAINKADDGKKAEILIYEVIGFDFWTGEGMTAKQFAEELAELGDVAEINVRINSPGGDVFDGITIYNLLARHPATIIVDIDGMAASIASVVAMAGDTIRMAETAMMMIHDAWGITIGNAADHLAMAEVLDKIDGQIALAYRRQTSKTEAAIRALMDEETEFTAAEAVKAGFADEVTVPKEKPKNKRTPTQAAEDWIDEEGDRKRAVAVRRRRLQLDEDEIGAAALDGPITPG